MDISAGLPALYAAAEALKNWGRWGDSDQIGTLNHIQPEDIVAAAKLVKTGKVFAMGIPLNNQGPQSGLFGGRWNPIHTMLATGTDWVAGRFDQGAQTLRYADDALNMPVQAATHWDSLGHIFLDDKMYNGHDAPRVDSGGVQVLGIEHARAKMVGRGVLLDVPRHKGVQWLPDGYGISNAELDAVAAVQGVEIRRGEFVIVRTGQLERCRAEGAWGGALCRRRRAGCAVRELLLVPGEAARSDLLRHLGRGSATERNRPGQATLALGGDPGHGSDHGGDVRRLRIGGGLRGKSAYRRDPSLPATPC